MCETWPFIEDVLGQDGMAELPAQLREQVATRYREHGGEYATNNYFPLPEYGKMVPINQCMNKDNLLDVEEELVDAVFNALIYHHRTGRGATLLASLLHVWRMLQLQCELEQRRAPEPA